MRRSIPEQIPMQTHAVGDDGCVEWHVEGNEVPAWFESAWIAGTALVALGLVWLLVFAAGGVDLPQPNPSNLPSPYGPPAATLGR